MCPCKKIFKIANEYIKTCNWKDLAIIKFCLCAIGILIGLSILPSKKACVKRIATLVFIGTYIPAMTKFVLFVKKSLQTSDDCDCW